MVQVLYFMWPRHTKTTRLLHRKRWSTTRLQPPKLQNWRSVLFQGKKTRFCKRVYSWEVPKTKDWWKERTRYFFHIGVEQTVSFWSFVTYKLGYLNLGALSIRDSYIWVPHHELTLNGVQIVRKNHLSDNCFSIPAKNKCFGIWVQKQWIVISAERLWANFVPSATIPEWPSMGAKRPIAPWRSMPRILPALHSHSNCAPFASSPLCTLGDVDLPLTVPCL